MRFNKLRLTLQYSLYILLMMYGLDSYSYSAPTDNRGFPVQQPAVSSFGAPSISFNPPNVVSFSMPTQLIPSRSPNTVPTIRNNTKPVNQHHNHNHSHDKKKRVNHAPYYYNYNAYPFFYYYYPGNDSYFYSSPPGSTMTTNTSYSQDAQTKLPTYNPSSLPNGTWVTDRDGSVPDKAYVFQILNGTPAYYCRVPYKYTTYYGILAPNVGCYIQDESAIIRFGQYDVLISPN